jgi:hypothetical protein
LFEDGQDANGDPVYVAIPAERNALRHPVFASLDVRASRSFDLRRGIFTAFIEISNLSNRNNRCCIDWDVEDGTNGLQLENSPDYWLPRLPAIGFRWEF